MQVAKRDLLEVLKTELNYLEMGGYSMGKWASWGPQYVFEDSPTCINFGRREDPIIPCTECVLIDLVPPERRSEKTPCRHIPLNALGETLDSVYRYGDPRQGEAVVVKWLRATIDWMEKGRGISSSDAGEDVSMAAPSPFSKTQMVCLKQN